MTEDAITGGDDAPCDIAEIETVMIQKLSLARFTEGRSAFMALAIFAMCFGYSASPDRVGLSEKGWQALRAAGLNWGTAPNTNT